MTKKKKKVEICITINVLSTMTSLKNKRNTNITPEYLQD